MGVGTEGCPGGPWVVRGGPPPGKGKRPCQTSSRCLWLDPGPHWWGAFVAPCVPVRGPGTGRGVGGIGDGSAPGSARPVDAPKQTPDHRGRSHLPPPSHPQKGRPLNVARQEPLAEQAEARQGPWQGFKQVLCQPQAPAPGTCVDVHRWRIPPPTPQFPATRWWLCAPLRQMRVPCLWTLWPVLILATAVICGGLSDTASQR